MNKLLYIILSIGVGIALLGCDSENIRKAASDEDNAPAVTHTPGTDIDTELPDSLLTRDHIQEYTFSDTVKAARIINAMRRRGLASAYVLDVA